MILALATLLAAPLQGPVPTRTEDEGWQLLDGVAAQAGDGIVTMRALDLLVRERLEKRKAAITSREEFERESNRISLEGLRELLVAELEAQGGQDMGLDPNEIDQMISLQILSERKEQGAASYLDQLAKEGTDPLADLGSRSKVLYRQLWARSKLGFSGPAGSRPTRDRFIRPGELKLIYRSNRDALAPPQVNLQMIVMPIAAAGSLEAARAAMNDALARAQAGEDFGDLVDEYSSEGREVRGIRGMQSVADYGNTPLGRWAIEAQVDDFSPVTEMPPGQPQFLILARMLDRDDPPAPEFKEGRVQRNLRRVFSNIRDSRIMEYEQALLGETAYTWLHPGLRGAREALAAQGLGTSEPGGSANP